MGHATGMNRKEIPFAIHESFLPNLQGTKSEPWGDRRGCFLQRGTKRSEKMTDELKPVRCGCGGEAIANDYIDRLENKTEYFVHCVKCGICSADYDTESEAITAWNRAMGTENICKNCKAYFVMGDCGYCQYDDEYPTADGYGCNCFSRRES